MRLNGELRIAISGKSGCGNTTVSGLLSEKLGVKLINYTFRQLAAEKSMTLSQVIENATIFTTGMLTPIRLSLQKKNPAFLEAALPSGC